MLSASGSSITKVKYIDFSPCPTPQKKIADKSIEGTHFNEAV
jgi:hypothetical protein